MPHPMYTMTGRSDTPDVGPSVRPSVQAALHKHVKPLYSGMININRYVLPYQVAVMPGTSPDLGVHPRSRQTRRIVNKKGSTKNERHFVVTFALLAALYLIELFYYHSRLQRPPSDRRGYVILGINNTECVLSTWYVSSRHPLSFRYYYYYSCTCLIISTLMRS